MCLDKYYYIHNIIASIIIVVGLPLGLYIVFYSAIDEFTYASTEIGQGFMRGIQNEFNQTALEELFRKLSHIIIIDSTNDIPYLPRPLPPL